MIIIELFNFKKNINRSKADSIYLLIYNNNVCCINNCNDVKIQR